MVGGEAAGARESCGKPLAVSGPREQPDRITYPHTDCGWCHRPVPGGHPPRDDRAGPLPIKER